MSLKRNQTRELCCIDTCFDRLYDALPASIERKLTSAQLAKVVDYAWSITGDAVNLQELVIDYIEEILSPLLDQISDLRFVSRVVGDRCKLIKPQLIPRSAHRQFWDEVDLWIKTELANKD